MKRAQSSGTLLLHDTAQVDQGFHIGERIMRIEMRKAVSRSQMFEAVAFATGFIQRDVECIGMEHGGGADQVHRVGAAAATRVRPCKAGAGTGSKPAAKTPRRIASSCSRRTRKGTTRQAGAEAQSPSRRTMAGFHRAGRRWSALSTCIALWGRDHIGEQPRADFKATDLIQVIVRADRGELKDLIERRRQSR